MYTIIPFLLCTLVTNIFSMDNVSNNTNRFELGYFPQKLTEKIFITVLSEMPQNANALSLVSHFFSRIVNNPNVIKNSITLKRDEECNFSCAKKFNIRASKTYIQVNNKLLRETDKEAYFNALTTNPYADVNYTKPYSDTYSSPKLYQVVCAKKFNWVEPMLEHGAHPDVYFKESRCSASFNTFINIVFPNDDITNTNNVELMNLFFKHGANIHGIKNNDNLFWDALFNDCTDGLTLLVKNGIEIANYDFLLHEYLRSKEENEEDPELETVNFLLEHGCNPYEIAEKTDENKSESAMDIIENSDSEIKDQIISLFKKYKKDTI